MSRTRLALAATLVFLVAPAALARADNYCVSDPGCVSAGGTDEGAGLQTALTAAQNHPGPDSVQIGPGTFTSSSTGFAYDSTDAVSVTGSGQNITTITGPVTLGIHVLTVTSSAASSISNLSLTVPASKSVGIATTGGVTDVAVTGDSTTTESFGIRLLGSGSVSHATVDLPRGLQGGVAIQACGASDTLLMCNGSNAGPITDSTLFGAVPISANGLTSPLDVDRVVGRGLIGVQVNEASVVLDDSLMLIDPGSSGIGVETTGDPPFLTLDNDTIVGSGTPGSLGLRAQRGDALVRNSIITGFGTAIDRETGIAVETDYSDYSGPIVEEGSGGTGTATENNHLDVDPGFANPAAGDYSLSPTSALVNAGDPAGPASGDSLTDLAGNPRVFGGRLDVGAYELQSIVSPPPSVKDTTAPVFSRVSETNRVFAVGKGATPVSAKRVKVGTTFRYTLSEAAKVKFTIAQKLAGRRVGKACRKPTRKNAHGRHCTRFVKRGTLTRSAKAGANSLHFTGRIGRRALKPGSYRATIGATDAAGNVSKPKTLAFRIAKRR
jgi:hypothetical protein